MERKRGLALPVKLKALGVLTLGLLTATGCNVDGPLVRFRTNYSQGQNNPYWEASVASKEVSNVYIAQAAVEAGLTSELSLADCAQEVALAWATKGLLEPDTESGGWYPNSAPITARLPEACTTTAELPTATPDFRILGPVFTATPTQIPTSTPIPPPSKIEQAVTLAKENYPFALVWLSLSAPLTALRVLYQFGENKYLKSVAYWSADKRFQSLLKAEKKEDAQDNPVLRAQLMSRAQAETAYVNAERDREATAFMITSILRDFAIGLVIEPFKSAKTVLGFGLRRLGILH